MQARPWRNFFPALEQQVGGRPLIYMDTAATALRPRQVIDAITRFYETDNANPGDALHTLARRSAETYANARAAVASFVGAASPGEIVFTRGTTEGLNLVATAWGGTNLRPAPRRPGAGIGDPSRSSRSAHHATLNSAPNISISAE